jgi:hypothetical protein
MARESDIRPAERSPDEKSDEKRLTKGQAMAKAIVAKHPKLLARLKKM